MTDPVVSTISATVDLLEGQLMDLAHADTIPAENALRAAIAAQYTDLALHALSDPGALAAVLASHAQHWTEQHEGDDGWYAENQEDSPPEDWVDGNDPSIVPLNETEIADGDRIIPHAREIYEESCARLGIEPEETADAD